MKSGNLDQTTSLEIPYLLGALGVPATIPDVMVFDSESYPSDSIQKRPFRSSHYSIVIILKGSMTIKVNLNDHTLIERDVLLIAPSAIRLMVWDKTQVHFLSLLFKPEFLFSSGFYSRNFTQMSFLTSNFRIQLSTSPANHAILMPLIKLLKELLFRPSSPTNDQVFRQIFQATLLELRSYYDDQVATPPVGNHIVQRFFDLLTLHYKNERKVAFYADRLHLHTKYLSQVVKEQTGQTARDYIVQMVLLEAKVLLNNPALSVAAIADVLHFATPFHFSQFFKKYTHFTPSDYRNFKG